ncbi:MAG TPA: hypothetical protein VIH90_03580 [Candidatus Saccharimonadales bacterium]
MKLLNRLKLNSKGFGHVEILAFLVVFVAIGGLGYYVYNKNIAHAGSWTPLSFQPVASGVNLSGLSAEACQTLVNSNHLVQIAATDTNSSFGTVQYKTFIAAPKTVSGYRATSQLRYKTKITGPNQLVNLTTRSTGAIGVSVYSNNGSKLGGYFYQSNAGAVSSSVSGSSSGISQYIVAANLSTCPGSSPVSGATSGAVSGSATSSTGSTTTVTN